MCKKRTKKDIKDAEANWKEFYKWLNEFIKKSKLNEKKGTKNGN